MLENKIREAQQNVLKIQREIENRKQEKNKRASYHQDEEIFMNKIGNKDLDNKYK